MDEVIIPGGMKQVTVKVEGGTPGKGTLYMKAAGFGTVQVPLQVY